MHLRHLDMYKKIRTGVIGVGSMGQNHARIYNEVSNLIGVADPNEKQGRLIAKRFGVEWFSDYNEMLEKVDAVTVAVPTVLHRKVAENVAKKGVHLLVEKPLAGNVEDSKAIIEASDSNSVILSVGHVERHNPVIEYTKKAIDSGKWGDIISISSRRVSRYPERIKDVGVVFDLGIHDLDILRYLAGGEVNQLFALGGSFEYKNIEDHASVMLGFDNGIKSFCEVSWLTPMKVRQAFLTCTKAYIIMDYMDQTVNILSSKYENIDQGNLFDIETSVKNKKAEVLNGEPLKKEILDFLKSIVSNQEGKKVEPLVTGKDGLEAVILAEKVLKSLKLGNIQ